MKYPIRFIIYKGFADVEVPDEIEAVRYLLTGDIQGGSPQPWLELIDMVLSGQSEYEEITGNSCTAEIKKDFTLITNNFTLEDVESKIETTELRALIELWIQERTKLFEEEDRLLKLSKK